ncbi:MAG: leucine--tRNA ligase [Candidatus Micrarchaeota archaeon]
MHTKIEEKWAKKWNAENVYNPEPSKKEKKMITAAFPYPNSPQHIGHGRTYTTADIYARFLRMKGYCTLFPMGFHVTGTPIIAMAKRIADKDEEVLSVFENIYGIDRKTAAKLTKPEDLVMYFSKEIEVGMHEMGYSIDWRRKFYSSDKKFNRFIQWQFRRLKKLGYIVQGKYPIAWCPVDNQAVGGHDTKGDVDPELKEFTAIKFGYEDGFILTATLRPETIYGVTNIWVNPSTEHVKAMSKKTGDIYYISKKTCDKMNSQGFELQVIKEFYGKEMVGRKAKNIVTGEEVPIYKAEYVKDDVGTGIVMSVPSHAPYDHMGLVDLGIKLDYTPIIKVEGYKFMALELLEKMGVKDQHDPKIEDIVKEVYKKEILTGIMVAGPHSGEKVSVAIEKTKNEMFAKKQAVILWEISNKPVRCRCGAEVIVNIIDQWFIDYGIVEWKKKAEECLGKMTIIPEKTRSEYEYAINWFKQKPCARSRGLGTKFPFDEKLVIEALSDSTIYMAFYTISHLLGEVDESEMGDEFFDYVFLGEETKHKTWNPKLEKLRQSFSYWYPCDSRHSGADLVRNHLPFYIFNHVAIFEKKNWPKQIVTNGFVLMDGKKMSKSMGNILPLRKAIKEFGADVVRFSTVSGADLTQDTDFNKSVAEGTKTRLEFFSRLMELASKEKGKAKPGQIDKWLMSRLNRKIRKANELYPNLALRELALEIFYDIHADLSWYLKRAKEPRLESFFKKWTLLISPFMPFHAEEFWSMLGGKGFCCEQKFPECDDREISKEIEDAENAVKQMKEDIDRIKGFVIKDSTQKIKSIEIYVASQWKRDLQVIMREEKALDKIMKIASAKKMNMGEVQRIVKQTIKNVYALPVPPTEESEMDALKDAKEFFEKEYSCEVRVMLEDKAGAEPKAKNALPGKPAIKLDVE